MKHTLLTATLTLFLLTLAACDRQPAAQSTDTAAPPTNSVLVNLQMQRLTGGSVDLEQYHGKVLLIVNVASECGNTPQYEALQALHERYADRGLAVVGIPSNDFNGQEPGSAEEIAQFCEENFGVQFDMLEKAHVLGDNKIELYQRLTDPDNDPTAGGEIQWNFEKFLLDTQGNVINRFRPTVQPDSDEVIQAIEDALGHSA